MYGINTTGGLSLRLRGGGVVTVETKNLRATKVPEKKTCLQQCLQSDLQENSPPCRTQKVRSHGQTTRSPRSVGRPKSLINDASHCVYRSAKIHDALTGETTTGREQNKTKKLAMFSLLSPTRCARPFSPSPPRVLSCRERNASRRSLWHTARRVNEQFSETR